MSYTDNDFINLEYYGGFANMPNITISETDKSQVDNIYINSSYFGKVLISDTPEPSEYLYNKKLSFTYDEDVEGITALDSTELSINDFDIYYTYKLKMISANGSVSENITQIAESEGNLYFYNGTESGVICSIVNDEIYFAKFDTTSEDEGDYTTTIEKLNVVTELFKFYVIVDVNNNYEVDACVMPKLFTDNGIQPSSSVNFSFYNSDTLVFQKDYILDEKKIGDTIIYYSGIFVAAVISGTKNDVNKIVISQGEHSVTLTDFTKVTSEDTALYGNNLLFVY